MRTDSKVKDISISQCQLPIIQHVDPSSLLCILNPPSSPCTGDSGGPITLEEYGMCMLVGVISQGIQCGTTGKSSMQMKVSYYLDWIYQNIMDKCKTP
ncbi:tryptase [Lepeophtheirus salmonis]|uniref:tryptase n=1 Tax=Lepeophtheirus salmonis TaxID=72036 RepID=UPI001AE9270C|nr:tryptase beta-2-like [Lepeophtheirus salmonis]